MHTKFRNSMIALSAVLAFVVGGAFFSEPLRAGPTAGSQVSTLSPEARIALAVLSATVSIAQASAELDAEEGQSAETVEPDASQPREAPRPRSKRPALGMPYFSFASFLPRTPQES